MRIALCICAVMAVSGCDVANQTADTVARESAKGVVNGVIAQRFPAVNAAPVTDCVIDNASRGEIFDLARTAATGVTPQTAETVLVIVQRPETVSCISKNGLGLFL